MLANDDIEWVGGQNWEKLFYWFISCFGAFRSFLSNKKKSEKPEIVRSGGTSPPLFGKRPNYFRFFLVKTSLSGGWYYWGVIQSIPGVYNAEGQSLPGVYNAEG